MVPIRMLTIDDKTLTTDLDRAGYKRMGVTVRSVQSYKDAEKELRDGNSHLLVINFDFKRIDAIETARHLKKGFPHIPVVITSVQSDAKTKKACLDSGADLFVEQPIPRQVFIENMRKLLEQKTRETERFAADGEVLIEMDDGAHWICPIGDVSMSGMLLATDLNIKPGTLMRLSFQVGGFKKPIRVKGAVVRRINDQAGLPKGIGVRFDDFLGDSLKRLEKYVTKVHSDDPRLVYYL